MIAGACLNLITISFCFRIAVSAEYPMKEESQLTEGSLNSCQEKSTPIFFTDKSENKERLGKKIKKEVYGEHSRTLAETVIL